MEATKPLITFIITTYNLPAHYLLRCIDSVFSSSLNKDEFEIVVFGGKGEQEICEKIEQILKMIN